jgi:hypothetical protein
VIVAAVAWSGERGMCRQVVSELVPHNQGENFSLGLPRYRSSRTSSVFVTLTAETRARRERQQNQLSNPETWVTELKCAPGRDTKLVTSVGDRDVGG